MEWLRPHHFTENKVPLFLPFAGANHLCLQRNYQVPWWDGKTAICAITARVLFRFHQGGWCAHGWADKVSEVSCFKYSWVSGAIELMWSVVYMLALEQLSMPHGIPRSPTAYPWIWSKLVLNVELPWATQTSQTVENACGMFLKPLRNDLAQDQLRHFWSQEKKKRSTALDVKSTGFEDLWSALSDKPW